MTLLTELGSVFVSNHAYDRFERHSIHSEYAKSLINQVNGWRESGGKIVGETVSDGVEWRVVLAREQRHQLDHDWDLVTVVPVEVSQERAIDCDLWDETDVLNLKLYSNG